MKTFVLVGCYFHSFAVITLH